MATGDDAGYLDKTAVVQVPQVSGALALAEGFARGAQHGHGVATQGQPEALVVGAQVISFCRRRQVNWVLLGNLLCKPLCKNTLLKGCCG